eukprot:TRINITY_DN4349_c0_g1_i2.p2 TRINITY_DN4349_c0_g1~~TRINITY_DN4349_c0_g1_i2.p2  ORF type:complete len:197 (-),score=63.51 TRINITY_DN4349_c0_g1_i2:149-739(-)
MLRFEPKMATHTHSLLPALCSLPTVFSQYFAGKLDASIAEASAAYAAEEAEEAEQAEVEAEAEQVQEREPPAKRQRAARGGVAVTVTQTPTPSGSEQPRRTVNKGKRALPTTTAEPAVAAPKTDPFHKARLQFEEQQRAKLEAVHKREQHTKELKEKRLQRHSVNRQLAQRTRKGQPVMSNVMNHLLSKLQRQQGK